MKSKLILLGALLMASVAFAQTKLGTIDNDYIINLMPEAKIVVKMAQEYGQKLDSSFSIKMQEYQAKVDDYKKNEKEYGELMKKTLITEIQTMEQDIQKYQENGSKLMQLKQNELMRPLYKKLNDVIDLVAKENKYTQILTIQGNQFAYIDQKFDITKLVMDKLGLKEPEVKE
ncbi:MAG: OmpH family outer membrane protein [Polaribacter sp.]|jgi:outer membrane protein|nr:OmpH family outer membrane protein [Polaribacter sp.]